MSSYIKLKSLVRNKIVYTSLRLHAYSLKNAIILTSEPRSGSTWLMEVIADLLGCVVNWEPLHVDKGIVPKNYKLGERPFIKTSDNTESLKSLFEDMLTFKKYSVWTTQHIAIRNLLNRKYVLTKFVRANNLLPWFTSSLALEHKPILLLRHPITTCSSQLKNFQRLTGASLSQPYRDEKLYSPPDCINNDRYIEHQHYVNSLQTPLERQIALWCINNYEVLNHPDREKWITVYYEHLMLNPGEELNALFKKLNLSFAMQDADNVDFRKPSRTNFLKEYNRNPTVQLESFLESFDEAYLQKIQDILDYFEIANYAAFDAYPINKTY